MSTETVSSLSGMTNLPWDLRVQIGGSPYSVTGADGRYCDTYAVTAYFNNQMKEIKKGAENSLITNKAKQQNTQVITEELKKQKEEFIKKEAIEYVTRTSPKEGMAEEIKRRMRPEERKSIENQVIANKASKLIDASVCTKFVNFLMRVLPFQSFAKTFFDTYFQKHNIKLAEQTISPGMVEREIHLRAMAGAEEKIKKTIDVEYRGRIASHEKTMKDPRQAGLFKCDIDDALALLIQEKLKIESNKAKVQGLIDAELFLLGGNAQMKEDAQTAVHQLAVDAYNRMRATSPSG